jgi:hypothetical protein
MRGILQFLKNSANAGYRIVWNLTFFLIVSKMQNAEKLPKL